jgi:hypothetical protein
LGPLALFEGGGLPILKQKTMALDLKIKQQINFADELFILQDETGDYSATNTNPARSAVALLVYAVDATGSSDVSFPPISYDPVTVVNIQFNASAAQDRYIRAYVFAVLIETGAENTGDYYWNAADGLNTVRLKTAGGYDPVAVSSLISVDAVVQEREDAFVSMYSSNTLINVVQKNLHFINASANDCFNPTLEEVQTHDRQLTLKISVANYSLVNALYAQLKIQIQAINTWITNNINYT